MSRTPALVLLGLLLVMLAIPLAFSLAPFVVGVIVLIVAGRRAHRGLAEPSVATAAALTGPGSGAGQYAQPASWPGPAASMAASTPSA